MPYTHALYTCPIHTPAHNTYAHAYTHAHTRACSHACTQACLHTCLCTYACRCANTHVYTHANAHAYTHVCTHICTHASTHRTTTATNACASRAKHFSTVARTFFFCCPHLLEPLMLLIAMSIFPHDCARTHTMYARNAYMQHTHATHASTKRT